MVSKLTLPDFNGGYALTLNTNTGLTLEMPQMPPHPFVYFVMGQPISAQQWHFVAVSATQRTGQGYFYVDGALAGSTFTFTPVNLANTNSLYVGSIGPSPSVYTFGWQGALDEVEVYNRALSTNELNAIYGAGTAGKCKPCCYLNNLTIGNVTPNSVEVNWGGCGILLETTNMVTGPWVPLPNAASPYVIPAIGREMFYRLSANNIKKWQPT